MAGPVRMPADEAVLTTWPSPCSIILGTNARMPWATPSRLTSTIQRQRSAGTVQVSPPVPTPALLHTTWAVPNRSNVAAARASTAASSRTSVGTASTLSAPIRPPSSAAAASSTGRSTSAMTTRMPSSPNRVASALPMPDAAPVTTATFPAKLYIRPTLGDAGPADTPVRSLGAAVGEVDPGGVAGRQTEHHVVGDQRAVGVAPGLVHQELPRSRGGGGLGDGAGRLAEGGDQLGARLADLRALGGGEDRAVHGAEDAVEDVGVRCPRRFDEEHHPVEALDGGRHAGAARACRRGDRGARRRLGRPQRHAGP